MPIKLKLHDSTSQVEASGNSGTISDKRLELLIEKEIENRIAGDEYLQEEIDEIIEGGAWYLLIDEKENGSIDISLLNKDERVLCTKTIHLTEKIIKEGILDYANSKIIYTCNDDSTIELDISDIVDAIHTLESDLTSEISRATSEEARIEQKLDSEIARAQQVEDALDDKIDQEIQDRIEEVEAEELRATTRENAIASDLSDEITRATTSEQTINTRIDNLDLNTIGQDGSYIKTVGQQDGQLSATKQAFDVDMTNATNNNAPTTKNAKDYTDAQVTIENNRAIAQETLLGQEIDAEEERALQAEETLQANIESEETRAKGVENSLSQAISSETTARTNADTALQSNIDAEETRAKGVETTLSTNIANEEARAREAETALGTRIDDLDLSQVGANGSYIKLISQEDGRVSASSQAFDTTLGNSSSDNNAPTSKAVKDYVDTYGGKIDSISIDGTNQPIINKNVDLPAYPTRTSLNIDNVDNTSDLNKPISTATQAALDDKVDKKITSGDFVYTHNTSTQSEVAYTSNDTASTIVMRDANKQINVAQTPTSDSHAAAKKYVDTQDSAISSALTTHINDTSNPHHVTATDVGLGSVDNTSDMNKPVSTAQQNAINAVDDKLNANVHIEGNSDEITYNGDTVTKTSPYKNLKTGVTGSRSEVIHLANSTTAGMMSPADYNQIRDNTSRIEALEGTKVRIEYTTSSNPTAAQIKTFVDNYLATRGIVNPTDEDYNSVSVVVKDTKHIWNYYANSQAYQDDGLDTVTQFTNSVAGIILGSSSDGQVYAENNGTGSVYGWSALKTRVSNLETDDASLQQSVTNLENNKVDKVSGKGLSTNDFTNAYKDDVDANTNARHTHSNKTILDNTTASFTTTDKSNLDSNTSARHTHSNKALLDDYTQTEANLADAVAKKHSHSNKAILDATEESFTTTLKNKLDGVEAGAQVNVNADWNASSGDAQILNKPTLATVATSGSYNDLSDLPTNLVTTDTEQTITAKKTICSNDTSSLILQKGSSANRVGISLMDTNGTTELGFFQYNGQTKKTVFGCAESSNNQLAFRSFVGGHSYNVNVPKGANKDSSIGSGDINMPLGVSVNGTVYTANNGGLITLPDYPNGGVWGNITGTLSNQTDLQNALNAKQDALQTQTAYTTKGSATKVPQITTNSLGQVTGITEVTITQPSVYDGTLTIQKNGTTVATFTANQSTNATANISVPTNLDEIADGSSRKLSNYLPLSGGTITATSGDAPLTIKSASGSSYTCYKNSSGTILGYIGVNSSKKPVFYDSSDHQLAYVSDIPSLSGYATETWVSNNFLGKTAKAADSDKLDNHDSTYFINTDNIGSQSVNYATSSGNADTVDNLHASDFLRTFYNHELGADTFDNRNYFMSGGDTGGSWEGTTYPTSAHNGMAILNAHTHPGNYYTQLCLSTNSNDLFIRSANSDSSFGSWYRFAKSGDNVSSFNNDAGYVTSSGSVAYASSAGDADTLDSYHASDFALKGWVNENYLGINSNAVSASIPYGFSSRGTNDWSGVSGTMITDWSTSASGDIMFKDDGGKLNVITDGRFYQGIDIYGSSKRVLDEYDISHTKWGDADTLDGHDSTYFINTSNIGSQSVNYANTAGSASASDVYPWAKQPSKPSYNFSEIQPGTAVVDYSGGIVFRNETTAWYSGIYYSTPNEEAVVFANKSQGNQDNAYQQQWLFAYTDMQNREAWTDLGSKTAMQIKGHRVAINKMVSANTQIPYNLDVNGSANATTITVNTKATLQYNSTEDCLDFIFA